jgi:alkanesulfonate monooxygenase SsuD/methylene tetrahydromethanopterin reductase-like flavin-dependent oxidoreductase (luciferase family)
MVAVGNTDAQLATAIDRVAFLIAFYASTPNYRPVLDVEGWGDLQPKLNELSKMGQYAKMRALITDEMVETYGIVGTPEQCAAKIQSRYGANASDVCCYFPGYKPSQTDIADLVTALQRIPAPR